MIFCEPKGEGGEKDYTSVTMKCGTLLSSSPSVWRAVQRMDLMVRMSTSDILEESNETIAIVALSCCSTSGKISDWFIFLKQRG